MPETGVLIRSYFARGQVPDCPDVKVRKINYRPGINIYAPSQFEQI